MGLYIVAAAIAGWIATTGLNYFNGREVFSAASLALGSAALFLIFFTAMGWVGTLMLAVLGGVGFVFIKLDG
mgnify:CR=1 FL=1